MQFYKKSISCKNIIYCRVSSYDRKEDLERQEKKLKEYVNKKSKPVVCIEETDNIISAVNFLLYLKHCL